MKIIVGSLNKTKIDAVSDAFSDAIVSGCDIASNVLHQPIGEEMTRIGAINRAKQAVTLAHNCIGIGFEGGVTFIGEKLYLCNWGALAINEEHIFTASGAKIELPDEFIEPILQGEQLGDIMTHYTNKENIRTHEGAIGIFTNHLLLRKDMYAQIAMLLKGQYEYYLSNKTHP